MLEVMGAITRKLKQSEYYERVMARFADHLQHPFVLALNQQLEKNRSRYARLKMNGYAFVYDERGEIRHQGGVTASPGLYFMGHPWLTKRSSGILWGVGDDAARIVEHIEKHVLRPDAD